MAELHRHIGIADLKGLVCSCKSVEVVWVCVLEDKARFLCAPCEKAEVEQIRAAALTGKSGRGGAK